MELKWKKELETGIEALDEQHRGIFTLANNFIHKCNEVEGKEDLVALLDLLDSYAKKHFSYEEKLQTYNKYPGIGEQQSQHAQFLENLAELRSIYMASGPTRGLALMTKGRLIRWLTQHIKNHDKEFVDFLKTKDN